MIKVICAKCNAVREVKTGTLINLWCHRCNATEDVFFDKIVSKRCHACNYAEVVKAGQKTKIYHSQTPTSIRHDLQTIDDISDVKMPDKKTKKKTEEPEGSEEYIQPEDDEDEKSKRRPVKRAPKKE